MSNQPTELAKDEAKRDVHAFVEQFATFLDTLTPDEKAYLERVREKSRLFGDDPTQ